MVKKSIRVEYSSTYGALPEFYVNVINSVDIGCTMDEHLVPESEVFISESEAECYFDNDVMDYIIINEDVVIDTLKLENVIVKERIVVRGKVNNLLLEHSVVGGVEGDVVVLKTWDSEIRADFKTTPLYVEINSSLFCLNIVDTMRGVLIANSIGLINYDKASKKKNNLKVISSVLFGYANIAFRKFDAESFITGSRIITGDLEFNTEEDRIQINSIPKMLKGLKRCPKCGHLIMIEGVCPNFRCC